MVAHNRTVLYTQVALFWFVAGWLSCAVLGAGYAAWDLRKRGALSWGWPIGILFGGSLIFPFYFTKVRRTGAVAVILGAALVIAPITLFWWSTGKRVALVDQLKETHKIMPLRP